MERNRSFVWLLLILVGAAFLLLGALLSPVPVEAQCGSSASSCKNCHEVNAKDPVNTKGAWHVNHAFGDFCSFCHGGNVQAVKEQEAHQGMVQPLSNPQAACAACHADDYNQKAQVYAVALGVDLKAKGGSSSVSTGSSGSGSSGGNNAADSPPQPIPAPGENRASGPLIDYNQRYEVEVLGALDNSKAGNLILAVLALVFLVVGGVLVWHFEKLGDAWRQARAVPDWQKEALSDSYAGPVIHAPRPVVSKPAVALPKGIESLDAETQTALRTLLADPEHSAAIIRALSRLDPSLINGLQTLDKRDRALLLAIVEELGGSGS